MNLIEWGEALLLWGVGLLGVFAIIPYSMALTKNRPMPTKLPQPVLWAISLVQNGVLLALAVGVGLLAAHSVGLGAPWIEAIFANRPLPANLPGLCAISAIVGILIGAAIFLLDDWIFLPRLPKALSTADTNPEAWKGALASLYGGIDEEIFLRLFLMSALTWLITRFLGGGIVPDWSVWLAIILAALIFGLGHLPATAQITPLTPFIITRALLLNGLGGIVFGFLYWRFGLEMAMLAHFSADLVLHWISPIWRRSRTAARSDRLDSSVSD